MYSTSRDGVDVPVGDAAFRFRFLRCCLDLGLPGGCVRGKPLFITTVSVAGPRITKEVVILVLFLRRIFILVARVTVFLVPVLTHIITIIWVYVVCVYTVVLLLLLFISVSLWRVRQGKMGARRSCGAVRQSISKPLSETYGQKMQIQ